MPALSHICAVSDSQESATSSSVLSGRLDEIPPEYNFYIHRDLPQEVLAERDPTKVCGFKQFMWVKRSSHEGQLMNPTSPRSSLGCGRKGEKDEEEEVKGMKRKGKENAGRSCGCPSVLSLLRTGPVSSQSQIEHCRLMLGEGCCVQSWVSH